MGSGRRSLRTAFASASTTTNYENWPAEWRENFKLNHNYARNCKNPAFYIGPNFAQGGAGDLRLRNIEIAYNYVNTTGSDGLLLKSSVEGKNSIHHNVVLNAGKGGGANGISLFEGGAEIYNNWIENSGGNGIKYGTQNAPQGQFNPFQAEIFNNVIFNSGITDGGNGITVFRSKTDAVQPQAAIYNNTIVQARSAGITVGGNVNKNAIAIRNNIVADAQGNDIFAPGATISSNRTGSASSMGFRDPGSRDYRLKEASPAKDSATEAEYPSDDYDGTQRPNGQGPDQGAFEFASGSRPNPPRLLVQAQ